VLLLAFEDGAGLNLQHGCHHAVLFAPLATSNDSEGVIADAGKVRQAIGRVRRSGQEHKLKCAESSMGVPGVVVHRLVLTGPKGEKTTDGTVHERNQSDEIVQSSANV